MGWIDRDTGAGQPGSTLVVGDGWCVEVKRNAYDSEMWLVWSSELGMMPGAFDLCAASLEHAKAAAFEEAWVNATARQQAQMVLAVSS